jgi:hypothetical protein
MTPNPAKARYFIPLFQRQLLGNLLQDPEVYNRFPEAWSHTYFDETHHRQIAHAYFKIRLAGGEHPTEASLFQELFKHQDPRAPVPLDMQNLRFEAEALYKIPVANVDYSIKEVCAWAQNQALINAINESVDLLQSGKADEIRPTIDKALEVGQGDKVKYETLDDLFGKQIDASLNILGYRFLERETYGTIIGPSHIGKSLLSVQIALEAASGQPVFGIPVPRPLRVVLVQAEDSPNDRIEEMLMADKIAHTPALFELARKNLILNSTVLRGDKLFYHLSAKFDPRTCDPPIDLFIFNPAFAFLPLGADVNDAEDVGTFLRISLASFLGRLKASAFIVHHPPKLTHRDTSKWSLSTFMYSGHGSAEWTNAPRAALVIEETNDPKVIELIAAKRGSRTGWERSDKGSYSRYFRHATEPKFDSVKAQLMYFVPASPEDIDSATSEIGAKDEDVLALFNDTTCKMLEEHSIHQLLKKDGLEESLEKTRARIKRLLKTGKLYRIAEATAIGVREVFAREKPADVFLSDRLTQDLLYLLRQYAETGINTMGIQANIKKRKADLIMRLNQLVEKGHARVEGNGDGKAHVYFPV